MEFSVMESNQTAFNLGHVVIQTKITTVIHFVTTSPHLPLLPLPAWIWTLLVVSQCYESLCFIYSKWRIIQKVAEWVYKQ